MIAVVQREGGTKCVQTLTSLPGNDQDRGLWKGSQISPDRYEQLWCKEKLVLGKAPRHVDGRERRCWSIAQPA